MCLVRLLTVLCATLLTASSVCAGYQLGRPGDPSFWSHAGRNGKHSCCPQAIGALFMLVVDTVARTITAAELPISILTGLIGAPLCLAAL